MDGDGIELHVTTTAATERHGEGAVGGVECIGRGCDRKICTPFSPSPALPCTRISSMGRCSRATHGGRVGMLWAWWHRHAPATALQPPWNSLEDVWFQWGHSPQLIDVSGRTALAHFSESSGIVFLQHKTLHGCLKINAKEYSPNLGLGHTVIWIEDLVYEVSWGDYTDMTKHVGIANKQF